ncbi:MAG: hypothetical protein LBU35_00160 [Holosporales bacterium]|jgi:MtN3 and saliva related transmembrane protein|nr:hypothetical protein [Holosporales bacterium]
MISVESFFGTFALITSIIGLLPQIYKAYKTKSTTDVSMLMLINYSICSISWIIYGICLNSIFVVWSNIPILITCCVSVIQKYIYDKRNIKEKL